MANLIKYRSWMEDLSWRLERKSGIAFQDMSWDAAKPALPVLTSAQAHALFHLLTHEEMAREVESLKLPGFISRVGYPFVQPPSPPWPARPAGNEHGSDSDGKSCADARDSLNVHDLGSGSGSVSAESAPPIATVSEAPLGATLFRTLILTAPGAKLLPPTFWNVQVRGLLDRFADAELSESYDKGTVGTRRTLATAASVLLASVVRGMLAGLSHDQRRRDLHGPYDAATAADLVRAWDDVMHELAYGGLLDELFACVMTSGNPEKHSPAAERCVDYIIIHLATFLHYTLVLSPEGPFLLKLLERTHSCTPWRVIRPMMRQTNAATMINGMTHLMLAKVSIGAFSNWTGLTQNADDGMNLLQRIISFVLSTDGADFRKQAEKIEKAKSGPSKGQLAAIRDYVSKPRTAHDEARQYSRTHQVSLVVSILKDVDKAALLADLSPSQHDQCAEYLAALLSAHDRDEITRALCHEQPDLLTQAAREYTATLAPILRAVHERVELSVHMTSIETFINDLIRTSKFRTREANGNRSGSGHGLVSSVKKTIKKNGSGPRTPSIDDYVSLLRRNRHLLYNFLQEFTTKCADLRDEIKTWLQQTLQVFRQDSGPEEGRLGQVPVGQQQPQHTNGEEARDRGGVGRMSDDLQRLFSGLAHDQQAVVLASLDAHANYLRKLEDVSMARLQAVLDKLGSTGEDQVTVAGSRSGSRPSSLYGSSRATTPALDAPASMHGPGLYLKRWQDLLDATVIAPATPSGPVRHGKDIKGIVQSGRTAPPLLGDAGDPEVLAKESGMAFSVAPDVHVVWEVLGPAFRKLVGDRLERVNMQWPGESKPEAKQ